MEIKGHKCKKCRCWTRNENFLVCSAGYCHDGECEDIAIDGSKILELSLEDVANKFGVLVENVKIIINP